jgi:hypothetical protein
MEASGGEPFKNGFRVFVYPQGDKYRVRAVYSEGPQAWTLNVTHVSMRTLLETLRIEAAIVPSGKKDRLGHDVLTVKPVTLDQVLKALRQMGTTNGSLTLVSPNVDPRGMEPRLAQAAALPGVQLKRES